MFMYDHQNYFLVISSFLLFLLLPFCTSIDTLTSSGPVRDGDILVSNGESFALGFFSLNNSTNRYVGIWYNKVSECTIVWVANRDHPLNSSGGVLSVDDTGNLVLHDHDRNAIWSTNVSATGTTSNSFGQLLDSGNLVLFRGEGDGLGAWQSFDHPTDTTLPNMKIGWDRQTGLNRFTTSWKAGDDPGTGVYSFKIDFVGSTQMFLYRGTTPIWRAGTWNGLGWSGVPQMTGRHIFNGSFVDNQDEVTVVWGMINASVFSRMIVTDSGTVKRFTWREGDRRWFELWSAPTDQCDNYNKCGSFGYCDEAAPAGDFKCKCLPGFEPKSKHDWDDLRDGSSGCTRKSGVNVCVNGEGFKKMERVKVPDTSTARVNMSLGLEACEEMCLRNCSCMGYASGNFSSRGGCINWYENMVDIMQYFDGGQDLYIRVDAAELANLKSKSFNRRLVVGMAILSVGGVVLILIAAFWFARIKRAAMQRQRKVLFKFSTSTSLRESSMRKEIGENGTNADFRMFDLSVLVAATGNFVIANKLGEGGFGSVFKGQLPNGQEIAVKRLSNSSGQGMEEFTNEVTLIAKLQHRNLVRLLGCCVQKEEKMLVYEYLPNKGLDCFIFDKENAAQLDWRKRFDIILGIVRGLLYLHQDSRLRIIHRDLKASNVLLDAALNPKISDFGMARIVGGDQVEAITRRVVGTYGYMAPEYAMEGMFSIKSDVFSLGVLLLEIVSGRKNSSYYKQNSINLIGHVWELWKEGETLSIVDPTMGDSYEAREVLRCIHVGLLCVQELANDRPTMSEVAFMLCNETNLRSPNQPAFIFRKSNLSLDSGSASVGIISINEETMTDVEAR